MSDEIVDILNCKSGSSILSKTSNINEQCPSSSVVLGQTVCYIVGAVLMNEKDEILLIQEAKSSCKGTWYLPAGRVDPNETLESAVKREVLEEAGLHFQPSGIICVEENGARWIRFFFAGKITGGSLKTVAEADKESLQAQWCNDIGSMRLRCHDILMAIKHAKDYYARQKSYSSAKNLSILPRIVPYERMYLQTVLVLNLATESQCSVLMYKDLRNVQQLPVSCFQLHETVLDSVHRVIDACFLQTNDQSWTPKIIGLIGVEHEGNTRLKKDGLCLNVLATVEMLGAEKPSEDGRKPLLNSNCAAWHEIDHNLDLHKVLTEEQRPSLCVPLISLFH